jgi:hypothetical protein
MDTQARLNILVGCHEIIDSSLLIVSAGELREILQKLAGFQAAEKIAQPECKKCNDTGSLHQNGIFDCHYCGRAEENVRVLKWYAETMLGNTEEQDVLNIYYHGKAAGLAEKNGE